MLAIRLHRQGKKNQPFYKIVVTEKQKSSTRGRFIEEVGFYNPLTKERKIEGERVKHWISVGAQPTDTVHNMLVSEKIIDAPKIPKHKKAKKKESADTESASQEPPVDAPAAPETEQPKTEEKSEESKEEVKEQPAPVEKAETSEISDPEKQEKTNQEQESTEEKKDST